MALAFAVLSFGCVAPTLYRPERHPNATVVLAIAASAFFATFIAMVMR